MIMRVLLLALSASVAAFTPRPAARVVRHTRLPVWPAWQGLPLVVLSQIPALRGLADRLEDAFGGRVCPMQFQPEAADPFVLLVHHRHSFRPFDFFRPLFNAAIMPEGFPAHPHRGFETVTYVLPGRSGLTHRDSEGCKMRYGDGAVQWMTAGRGMLHEEMWDVEAWDTGKSRGAVDAELYQLWVNLPPRSKLVPPRVQLLVPPDDTKGKSTEVQREGSTPVRRATVLDERHQNGALRIRTLTSTDDAVGADTYSPMVIEHVELHSEDATYTLPLPEGWTCIVYVRRGSVTVGSSAEPTVAGMFETIYLDRRGGDGLQITNANSGGKLSDVLVLAGEPIGAPVVTSGTMVMNSDSEVQQAIYDYQRGTFGVPWDHELDDDEWARQCETRKRATDLNPF